MRITKEIARENLQNVVDKLQIPANAEHFAGKVRENIKLPNNQRAIIVTDRISAFDFNLGTIPFKGQVLNQLSAWWFRQLDGLVPHHFVDLPDPNISLVKDARVLPVEVVVRGYLTGSTATSSWYAYQNHDKVICGIKMPDAMVKNQKFESPIITPTTKPLPGSGQHDVPISREQIIEQGIVEKELYEQVEAYAMKLFAIGQAVAASRGLILVDTKYEFGLDSNGELMVIDEVHTPDSSRYWIAETYHEKLKNGEEPDMFDKEFVRRQLVAGGIDIHANPETYDGSKYLTDEMKINASQRYSELYERMTGENFEIAEGNASERIENMLKKLNQG